LRDFKYHVITYGCQMNKNDSEMVAGLLDDIGGKEVDVPEKADVVLINTCSVREHAERRALGTISAFKKLAFSGRRIIVMGCMAERMGAELMRQFPYLTAVVGPNYLQDIPQLLLSNASGKVLVGDRLIDFSRYKRAHRFQRWKAYVTIVKGCENFCTYCIVPYTRGRIQSRPMDDILEEVQMAVKDGAVEIHLLGQNVNEWGKEWGYKNPSFSDLLRHVSAIVGDEKIIRYTTPHPKYFGKDVVDAVADSPNITRYFHLPIQAGDNEVLRLMNRGYTVEEFEELISYIKEKFDRYALGTDVIVGFPGESRKAFENTLRVFERIRFDVAYIAMYSPRPGTAAAKWEDMFISDDEKKWRFDTLYALQERISWEKNQQYVGRWTKVLVEDYDEEKNRYIGRDDINKTVVFTAVGKYWPGEWVNVKIEQAKSWVLYGKAD